MQFSLRTVLFAVTAAALYIGSVLGLSRALTPNQGAEYIVALQVVSGAPLFVLWCLMGAWSFRRRQESISARLMFAAIATALASTLIGPFAFMAFRSFMSVQTFAAFVSMFHNLVQFATWLLLSWAVVHAVKSTTGRRDVETPASDPTGEPRDD